jgi:4-hydroxy-4-methyl-2-oxoglutarate aldolase
MALDPAVLERLARHSTPTICNAIEAFGLRPRHEGFMGPEIRCLFPELGTLVGFAVTMQIRSATPPREGEAVPRAAFWEYVRTIPAPRVVVAEDLDPRPVGAYWGEVQAHIHRALGCVGVVTNGGVRDLDEVRALGFRCFAQAVLVSHAWVHIVSFGTPVRVGGLEVRPGDLLHGDQHGVTQIPLEIAADLDEVVARQAERERRLIEVCRTEPFDLERLRALY